MKKTHVLILGAALLAVSLENCNGKAASGSGSGDNQPSKVTMTVDGDGFSNQAITINGAKGVPENEGVLFGQWNYTQITASDRASEQVQSTNEINFFFDDANTGVQQVGTNFKNGNGVQIDVHETIKLTDSEGKAHQYNSDHSGTITVTKYEAVGGLIEGDFSGTVKNVETGEPLTITNGHFSVPRNVDVKL